MRTKNSKCLIVFFLLSIFLCSACSALDEDGAMGSADMGDYGSEDATTEDRTLAPNEYEGDNNDGEGVVVEEEIPIGGSRDGE